MDACVWTCRTCELTIYIHEDHRSVKLGGSLMSRLIPMGRAKGYRCVIGKLSCHARKAGQTERPGADNCALATITLPTAEISNTALGSQALVRRWGFELKGQSKPAWPRRHPAT